jgi:beta-lactamase regulating signal transducer with metallopeptidase domain
MNEVLQALWRASWQGAIAVLVVWCICHTFRKLSPNIRTWLWRLVSLKMLIVLIFPGALSLPVLPPQAQEVVVAPPMQAQYAPQQSPISEPVFVPQTSIPTPVVAQRVARPFPVSQILLSLYLLGITTCLVRLGQAGLRMRDIARRATPIFLSETQSIAGQLRLNKTPRVAISAEIETPLVAIGTILMPSTPQSDAERYWILAHEIAHVKRRDLAWEWLGTLVQVMFFFHPLVHFSRYEERLARESAADALALQITEAPAAAYGKMLLELSVSLRPGTPFSLGTVGAMQKGNTLHRRLLELKHIKENAHMSRKTILLSFGILSLASVTIVLPWRLTQAQKPTNSPVIDVGKITVGKGEVHGVVLDEQGNPLPNATVRRSKGWDITQTTTGADGTFRFLYPYTAHSDLLDVIMGDTGAAISIQDAKQLQTLRLSKENFALVKGRFADQDGLFKGIGRCYWTQDTYFRVIPIDAKGEYQLVLPRKAKFNFSITRRNNGRNFQTIHIPEKGWLTTPEQGNLDMGYFRLPKITGIEGRVTTIDGTPIPNMNINFQNGHTTYGSMTDANGEYHSGDFSPLPPGKYTVVALPNNQPYAISPQSEGVVEVKLGKVVRQNLVLSRGEAIIKGYVRDAVTKKPVADVRVDVSLITKPERHGGMEVTTQQDGSYTIHVPKGLVSLTAIKGTEDIEASSKTQKIDIKAGETKKVDFSLAENTNLFRIRVLDPENKPIAYTDALLSEKQGGLWQVRTNGQGVATVDHSGDDPLVSYRVFDGKAFLYGTGPLTKDHKKEQIIHLTRIPKTVFTGVFVDKSGKPLKNRKIGAMRVIYSGQGHSYTDADSDLKTDSAGKFTLPVPPEEEYDLYLLDSKGKTLWRGGSSEKPLRLKAGENKDFGIITITSPAT